MVALVIDDKLYVANCGDSKAVLIRESDSEEGKKYESINVSTTFNANKNYEKTRLKA